jgi:hypothetical protein
LRHGAAIQSEPGNATAHIVVHHHGNGTANRIGLGHDCRANRVREHDRVIEFIDQANRRGKSFRFDRHDRNAWRNADEIALPNIVVVKDRKDLVSCANKLGQQALDVSLDAADPAAMLGLYDDSHSYALLIEQ